MIRKTHTLYLEDSSELYKLQDLIVEINKMNQQHKANYDGLNKIGAQKYALAKENSKRCYLIPTGKPVQATNINVLQYDLFIHSFTYNSANFYKSSVKDLDKITKIGYLTADYHTGEYNLSDIPKDAKFSYNKFEYAKQGDVVYVLIDGKEFSFVYDGVSIYRTKEEVLKAIKKQESEVTFAQYEETNSFEKLKGTECLFEKLLQHRTDLKLSTSLQLAGAGLVILSNSSNNIAKLVKDYGFKNIGEYEQLTKQFINVIRNEAHCHVLNRLTTYESYLNEEEKTLENDKAVKNILKKIKSTSAKESYQKVKNSRDYMNNLAEHEKKERAKEYVELSENKQAGKKEILKLNIPLTKERGFNFEKLSQIETAQELKKFLQNEINRHRENIIKSKEYLLKDDTVFEFKNIIAEVLTNLSIQEGSVFDLIIKDKMEAEIANKVLHGLVIGAMAIAVGILTYGTGTLAILGAAVNLGVGAYLSYEEVDIYKNKLAVYDVQLSNDEPSIVWVVVSVLGVLIDIGALAKVANIKDVIKNIIGAARKSDPKVLEETIKNLGGVDELTKQKIFEEIYNKNKKFFDEVHPKVRSGNAAAKKELKAIKKSKKKAEVLASKKNKKGVETGARNNKILNKVDDIDVTEQQKKLLSNYQKQDDASYFVSEEKFIRTYRAIEKQTGATDEKIVELVEKASYDVVGLDKVLRVANGKPEKLESLWVAVSGNHKNFERITKNIDNFTKQSVNTGLKPKYFNQENRYFHDIEIEHTIDKHIMKHFDVNNSKYLSGTNDMFPPGTTQNDVVNYIDEALAILKKNKGPQYPRPRKEELVKLSSGMEVYIGSKYKGKKEVIGMFYPNKGEGIISVSKNELKAIVDIKR